MLEGLLDSALRDIILPQTKIRRVVGRNYLSARSQIPIDNTKQKKYC